MSSVLYFEVHVLKRDDKTWQLEWKAVFQSYWYSPSVHSPTDTLPLRHPSTGGPFRNLPASKPFPSIQGSRCYF